MNDDGHCAVTVAGVGGHEKCRFAAVALLRIVSSDHPPVENAVTVCAVHEETLTAHLGARGYAVTGRQRLLSPHGR